MQLNGWPEVVTLTGGENTLAFSVQKEHFYATGYKVMQSYREKGLLCAYRTELNGTVRLVYDTCQYRPLAAALPDLTPEMLLHVFDRLFSILETVQKNGFIQEANILFTLEQIYIDPDAIEPHMVYLPVILEHSEHLATDGGSKIAWRTFLFDVMEKYPMRQDDRIWRLHEQLNNSEIPLSAIREFLWIEAGSQGIWLPSEPRPEETEYEAEKQHAYTWIKLVSIDSEHIMTVRIPADGGVIGRMPDSAQIVIEDRAISREHCRFSVEDNRWFIEDMNSKNGTFLNRKMLPPWTKTEILQNDLLRISQLTFKVLVENDK